MRCWLLPRDSRGLIQAIFHIVDGIDSHGQTRGRQDRSEELISALTGKPSPAPG